MLMDPEKKKRKKKEKCAKKETHYARITTNDKWNDGEHAGAKVEFKSKFMAIPAWRWLWVDVIKSKYTSLKFVRTTTDFYVAIHLKICSLSKIDVNLI